MQDYWVTIPAGEFQMGGEDYGVYPVNVDEFQIGKYEVTNRQYAQCAKAGICAGSAYDDGKALHPVVNVNWYDAVTYCEWAGGRLPTEAEWEKAARGTDERTYPWGEGIDCDYANYYGKDNGNDACVGDTTPVGSYESGKSPYGVYDMAGNVWEWTSSLYQSYPYDASDGREELSSSDYRVLRGGSWNNGVNGARSAYRDDYGPSITDDVVGFRCARSLP
jgi:serine/threonine-protein kinase